ncbi:MAG: 50S ribosomal protein L11 [Armatimonadetes bacterium]|nr:50S ribosomal protein L11 [Armatimonadota bacterium]
MAKKIVAEVTIQIPAGKAMPGPPVGPALGAYGINLPMFIKEYNERAVQNYPEGTIVPAKVTIFGDRSFTFELKTPPAAVLVRQALNLSKGSASARAEKVGSITIDQLRQIAQVKLPDLNTDDVDAAMHIIAGTCRQMGVTVDGELPGVTRE